MEWVTVEKENCYNWCNYNDLIEKVKPLEFKAFEKTTNLLFRQKLQSLELSKISWKIIWEGHYHYIGQTVSYIKYCILKNEELGLVLIIDKKYTKAFWKTKGKF